jgi:hypothetical protein
MRLLCHGPARRLGDGERRPGRRGWGRRRLADRLQLLVYAALGIGPIGALRPVWHTAVGFLVGVIWALVLILPSWLLSPHGQDRRAVAAVYQALAGLIVLCRAGRI